MHPLGCFGSSLAFDKEAAACRSCDGMAECEAKVTARHPTMQLLLARFQDVSGEPMSVHWMTPAEKKARKEEIAATAIAEAITRTCRDPLLAQSTRANIDARAVELFDFLMFEGIDPFHAPLDRLAQASPDLDAVLTVLRSQKVASMKELIAAVASKRAVKAATAQRYAYCATAILTDCDRATRSRPSKTVTNLELK